MIITCEACGTSFKVDSGLIKDSGSTVRCSKCRHSFIAYPPSIKSDQPVEKSPGDADLELSDLEFDEEVDIIDMDFLVEEISKAETEGGATNNLDEFDLEDEPVDETSGDGLAKLDGTPDATEQFKLDIEKQLDDLIPDDDLEEDVDGMTLSGETKEFELDLEDQLDQLIPDDETVDEEELEVSATEEFELDIEEHLEDLIREDETLSEADLDFELEELSLDAGEKTTSALFDESELEFELEAGTEEGISVEGTVDEAEASLDLEGFEELDLTDDSTASLKEEDLELNFGMEGTETAEGLTEEDFELDFDLGEEGEAKADSIVTEEFELNLDIAPEDESVETQFDLDMEEATEDAATADVDFDFSLEDDVDAAEEIARAKTEEFDLTDIEDFLDLESEMTEEASVATDKETEEAFTVGQEKESVSITATGDGLDIELETMLDEEEEAAFAAEKEAALDTVVERNKGIEEKFRREAAVAKDTAVVRGPVEEEKEEAEKELVYAGDEVTFKKSPKSNIHPAFIVVLILALIGALIYIALDLFGGKQTAPGDAGNLQIEMIANPAYQFVENSTSGELLVITGTVTNKYEHPRSNIRVKGTLYDGAGKVLYTSSAYAGNVLSDAELSALALETITDRLGNQKGDDGTNVGVKVNQKVPFTVIFSKVPTEAEEFTVEAVNSTK